MLASMAISEYSQTMVTSLTMSSLKLSPPLISLTSIICDHFIHSATVIWVAQGGKKEDSKADNKHTLFNI